MNNMVKLYGKVKTLFEIKYKDYETNKDIIIPKGTLGYVVDMFDNYCIVEFIDHDEEYMDLWDFKYNEIESVDK